jgi:hypothetical protein
MQSRAAAIKEIAFLFSGNNICRANYSIRNEDSSIEFCNNIIFIFLYKLFFGETLPKDILKKDTIKRLFDFIRPLNDSTQEKCRKSEIVETRLIRSRS